MSMCECGCGHRTAIAKRNDPRRGHLKGQPVRFIRGHENTGRVKVGIDKLRRKMLERVYKPSGDAGCWLWTGYRDKDGYGQCNANILTREVRAHRLAYVIFVGTIPDKMHVLHKCDTPVCVNPAHLFIGTNADNMADMAKKGRSPSGSRHPKAKLTSEQVVEIRASYTRYHGNPGGNNKHVGSQGYLAEKFGVSKHAIKCILQRKSWNTATP